MSILAQFGQPHEEALAILAGKAPVSRAVFDGLLPELRARAFTITGIEAANVLQNARDALAGVAQGETWDDAKARIVNEISPWISDEAPEAGGQSAAERRAELLLRTHGFQTFQSATWRTAQADPDTTHLQYLTMEDDRVRDSHAALDGVIVPKDDPFWDAHFPPWDWGCRCRSRPINVDLLGEAKTQDESQPPDDQLVIEGPALQHLRDGEIIRNGRRYDVIAPKDRAGDGTPFQFHPDNLRLPLDQLRERYDADVWAEFQAWAKTTEIGDEEKTSVWAWLNGEGPGGALPTNQPTPAAPKSLSFFDKAEARGWADANVHPSNLKLTKRQREELSRYQTSSTTLNHALQRKRELTAEEKNRVLLIDRGLEKVRLKTPLVLWHGAGGDSWLQLKAGQTFKTDSYLSTTLAESEESFKSTAWIKINAPADSRAFYMDKLDGSESHAEEVEFVLPRGSRLKIISHEVRDGVAYIEADLLP